MALPLKRMGNVTSEFFRFVCLTGSLSIDQNEVNRQLTFSFYLRNCCHRINNGQWIWRRVEKVSWVERKTNEEVLVDEKRELKYRIIGTKWRWI